VNRWALDPTRGGREGGTGRLRAGPGALAGYHLLPATCADLLRRLGRGAEAAAAYRHALALAPTEAERRYLHQRLSETAASRQQRAREYHAKLTELLAADRRGDAVELFMTMVGMPAEMIGRARRSPTWPALEALGPSLGHDSAVMGEGTRGAAPPTDRLAGITVPRW
jgi:tetratricopeptide (TPR) repeat protein